MKKIILILIALFVVLTITECDIKMEEPKYDFYENHNISVCGVNDPLQNIKWLREYCTNIKEKKDISSVYISLYKANDKDECVFCKTLPSSVEYASNEYYSSKYFYNCEGDSIFYWLGDLVHADPSRYYEFMEDKEYISELFHFIKQ